MKFFQSDFECLRQPVASLTQKDYTQSSVAMIVIWNYNIKESFIWRGIESRNFLFASTECFTVEGICTKLKASIAFTCIAYL